MFLILPFDIANNKECCIRKHRTSLLSPECPVLPMYLYFIVSYFTFTFTLYVFPVVRSFTMIVALPFPIPVLYNPALRPDN